MKDIKEILMNQRWDLIQNMSVYEQAVFWRDCSRHLAIYIEILIVILNEEIRKLPEELRKQVFSAVNHRTKDKYEKHHAFNQAQWIILGRRRRA